MKTRWGRVRNGAGTPAVVDLPPEIAATFSDLTFALSLEPAGGSPTGQPTGAVLASGAVVPI